MSISFTQIPINLRVPGAYVEVDNTKAVRGLGILPARLLVLGQKLAAGTAPALQATRVLSSEQAAKLYGRGSMLARMLERFKGANDFVEVYAVALNDLPAGVAATGAVTLTGAATGAGTLTLYVGFRRVRIAVAAGATLTALATALAAEINGTPECPASAAVDGANTAKVVLTAKHKGTNGNGIDIRANYYVGDATPAGLAVVVTAMTGGAGNPDIAGVWKAIGDEWFTDIVMPYTDAANLANFEAEMLSRFGAMRQIDGMGYTASVGTHGQLSALGESRNSPLNTIMGMEPNPMPAEEIAAVIAAVAAPALANDPARPVQTLVLTGVPAPAMIDRFTLAERNLLLYSGISTTRVDAGGNVVIERVVTTYRETAFGLKDPSYLNIETMKTLAYLRYDTRTFFMRKYPRHKLADDGTRFGPGQPVMTPKLARAELVARFDLWEEAGLVENVQQFKQDLLVERDGTDKDRLNAIIPPDIINQLRVFAGLLQFRL